MGHAKELYLRAARTLDPEASGGILKPKKHGRVAEKQLASTTEATTRQNAKNTSHRGRKERRRRMSRGKRRSGKSKSGVGGGGGDRRCSMCSARTGLADVQAGDGLFSPHSFIGLWYWSISCLSFYIVDHLSYMSVVHLLALRKGIPHQCRSQCLYLCPRFSSCKDSLHLN